MVTTRRRAAVNTAAIVLLVGTTAMLAQDKRGWRDYGGPPDNSRFVTLKQIDK